MQYAYIVYSLLVLTVWLVIFLARPNLRKHLLIASALTLPLGPLAEIFYLRDYWQPATVSIFYLEDILIAFGIGGIGGLFYESLFNANLHKVYKLAIWPTVILFIAGLSLVTFINLLGMNSIYSSVIASLVIGSIILKSRSDLIRSALLNGLLVAILILLAEFISFVWLFPGSVAQYWLIKNLSGIQIIGVPLEELLWGFGWGFLSHIVYKFLTGTKLTYHTKNCHLH